MGHAPLTLGTAGHIDHGKTALVRALTNVDTDRLPEERARGISIELGYAPLLLPSGRVVSVVDVPGHERFVRTMVAGATGVDLYLMVVAADDGVMPQTREHAAVLDALGVRVGVVAVTKADAADPARALAEARELLPEAPAVATSVRTGQGLEELLSLLDEAAERARPRAGGPGALRLHVDRSFTIHGAGTVVTGTLWSGAAARGDEVVVLPAGRRARVRAVQVHDKPVERAAAGQRVALNLAGIDRDQVARGDVVVARAGGHGAAAGGHGAAAGGHGAAAHGHGGGLADAAAPPAVATFRVDAALTWATAEARPDSHARVAVHHGTREAAARLVELGGRFFQLRLEREIVAAPGDRVVIRSLAPPDTLGGGIVLDAAPRRHGPSRDVLARLERVERGEPEPEPPPPPPPAAEPAAPPALSDAALEVEARLRAAGHEPPSDANLGADPSLLAALRTHGRAVRLGPGLHAHPEAVAAVRERVVAAIQRDGSITIAGLRDELGTSRKYAQALLEHLDAARVTLRVGDEHVLRRRR
jgi:selenocysteine-specific elongation factor